MEQTCFLVYRESGFLPQMYQLGDHDGGHALWDTVWISGMKDWGGISINQVNVLEGDWFLSGGDDQRIQGGYQTQSCSCEEQHYIETTNKGLLGFIEVSIKLEYVCSSRGHSVGQNKSAPLHGIESLYNISNVH